MHQNKKSTYMHDSPIRYTSPILVQAIQIQHCQHTTFNKNSSICRVVAITSDGDENKEINEDKN